MTRSAHENAKHALTEDAERSEEALESVEESLLLSGTLDAALNNTSPRPPTLWGTLVVALSSASAGLRRHVSL